MLDLGTSLLGSIARDPHALAIVDGTMRLTYREWAARISALVASLDALGLKALTLMLAVQLIRPAKTTRHRADRRCGAVTPNA